LELLALVAGLLFGAVGAVGSGLGALVGLRCPLVSGLGLLLGVLAVLERTFALAFGLLLCALGFACLLGCVVALALGLVSASGRDVTGLERGRAGALGLLGAGGGLGRGGVGGGLGSGGGLGPGDRVLSQALCFVGA
jgi:hypothetical protein